jgi:MFS family permease
MTYFTTYARRVSAVRNGPAVKLLSLGSFRALLLGNFSNGMGFELRLMAQAWLILEIGGSQLWIGAANGLRVVPFIALSLLAGVWVDRLGGRALIMIERAFLLALAALSAVLVITDVIVLWHVVVLSVVASSALAVGLPSMQSMIREVVPTESLQVGQSLNGLAFSFSRAVGPVGGGFLIAAYGVGSPWLALIGLYAVALGFAYKLPRHVSQQTESKPMLQEIRAGLAHIRSNPILLRIMILAFSVLIAAAIMPIIPIYARDRFDAGETGFGIMLASFALGQAAAAIFIVLRGGWEHKAAPIAAAAMMWSVAMIVFGFSTNYPLSLAALFLAGTVLPIWGSSVVTLLQIHSDRAMVGRVMSVYALSLEGFTLGWLIGAWFGQLIGNDLALLVSGLIFAAVHLGLIFTSRELRSV